MDDDGFDYSYWPDILARLARAIGRERTLALAAYAGGAHAVWIPREYKPTHLWAAVIPPEQWPAVSEVIDQWASEGRNRTRRISLPRGVYIGAVKPRIFELAEKGMSSRDICLELRVSQRYIERKLKGHC